MDRPEQPEAQQPQSGWPPPTQPGQPQWNPQTQQWDQPAAQPDQPAAAQPAQPQWNPQTQQWDSPAQPGQPAAQPGQPGQSGQPAQSSQAQAGQPQWNPQTQQWDQPAPAPQSGYPQQPQSGYPQQPYPQSGYPQQPYGSSGPPPAGHSRKTVYIAIAAVVVIAGAVVGIVLGTSGGGGSKTAAPADTVTTYLNDLAKGDAAGALAQGAPPASKLLLTDAILKKQQALDKISNIKVVSTDQGEDENGDPGANIAVTYNFGSAKVSTTYTVTKPKDKWVLANSVIEFDVPTDVAPSLTIFGIDVSKLTKAYVFPGPLVFGSANPIITVKQSNDGEGPSFSTDTTLHTVSPDLQAALSPAGKQAADKAVQTFVSTCAKSKKTDDGTCQLEVEDFDAVDGSVTWTPPASLSAVTYRLDDEKAMTVDVEGQLDWKCTYKVKAFMTNKITNGAATDSQDLYGSIDLSQPTPVLKLQD